MDSSHTTFGFREWTTAGKDFQLNGVPWHGWAETTSCHARAMANFYHQTHQTFMRFWGTTWMNRLPEQALGFLDNKGVVVPGPVRECLMVKPSATWPSRMMPSSRRNTGPASDGADGQLADQVEYGPR